MKSLFLLEVILCYFFRLILFSNSLFVQATSLRVPCDHVILGLVSVLYLQTSQSVQLNHVTATASQYLSRHHVTDWEKRYLEEQTSDRDEP